MFATKCIESGKRVLKEEAQSILNLIDTIDENFANAVSIILNCKGKVVLTGVGKSGHIATKIASTLASTGTQSFFVQAGEAAHGDLGMIGHNDVVIAISNSGEGNELKVMIPNLRRREIPLISITGNKESSLAKASNVALIAHVEREACPLNLAPTSSSTAELALGDAIAIALVEAKGFSEKDFALYHPGGALGRRLLVHCKDIMHKDIEMPIIHADETVEKALFEMTKKSLGMVCIVDNNNIALGIFTDGDLRRTLEQKKSLNTLITDVMTKTFIYVSELTLAADALTLMQNKKITSMVVLNDNKELVGAFNMHDLLKAGIV